MATKIKKKFKIGIGDLVFFLKPQRWDMFLTMPEGSELDLRERIIGILVSWDKNRVPGTSRLGNVLLQTGKIESIPISDLVKISSRD